MKNNRKGFTLLELLIAATIIGILAVFATIAYRNGAADTRLAGAKAKLEMLAGAVQKYQLDPAACPSLNSSSVLTISGLINCGFLEEGTWFNADQHFVFYICAGNPSSSYTCPTSALACMTGDSAKLPGRYNKSNGYFYCVNANGTIRENMGAE